MDFDNVSSLTIPEGEVGLVKGEDGTILWGKNLLKNFGNNATSTGIQHSWQNSTVTLSGTSTATYSNITTQKLGVVLTPGEYIYAIHPTSNVFRTKIRLTYGGTNHDQGIPKGSSNVSFTLTEEATIGVLFIDNFQNGTEITGSYWLRLVKVS